MKNVRLQFEVPEDRFEELKDLMGRCRITSQKDLFNSALLLLEWAAEERSRGRIIASLDEANMKYKEFAMPALEAVRQACVRSDGSPRSIAHGARAFRTSRRARARRLRPAARPAARGPAHGLD